MTVSVSTCYCEIDGLFDEMAYMELQKRLTVHVRRGMAGETDGSFSCLLCCTLQLNTELSTDRPTNKSPFERD